MARNIGRYVIEEEIGRGGFGQVFRAYDPVVRRPVALKTLSSGGEPELLARFQNEAAATGKLRHPNIIIIYDSGEHEGTPFLVMELLDGEDLERINTRRRPLTILQSLEIIRQVGAGLHHAHRNGIVHRDVKPANIMLLNDGSVKVMDFGVALFNQATAARITPQGSFIGTFSYMSPEQFSGTSSDELTDIFAVGLTCYKLLTGTHPFQAAEMGQLISNIMEKAPTPIRALNPDCPQALDDVVLKLLAKKRDARYQNLEDLQFDLEPIVLDLQREHAVQLLDEAKRLIDAQQFETAEALVREVLDFDRGNRTARELRDQIRHLLKDKLIRPRVAALVSEGQERLEARQFDQAIQKFESALLLDKTNSEVNALILQARAAWEESQRADRLLEQARLALSRDDLTAAHKNVTDALSADPEHSQAEALLAAVLDRIRTRERERRLSDGLNYVKRLIVLQSFDEAIDVLTKLKTEYPESGEIAHQLTRARIEQEAHAERMRLQSETEEAKELLRSGRLSQAVEHLSRLRTQFPESAGVRDLADYAAEELRAQEQAEAIGMATEQARSLMQSGDFDAALDRLRRALAEYPGASALRDLLQSVGVAKAEHLRKAAMDYAVQQGEVLIAAKRFAEALESFAAFARAYGEASTLDPLRRRAEEGLARQRQEATIRRLMLEAQTFLDEGKPERATQVLQQGTAQFPDQSDLTKLLGVALTQLQDQQKAEAISKIIADAESWARARQFDRALQLVDAGVQQYGDVPRFERFRAGMLALRASYERKQAPRDVLDQAHHSQPDPKLNEAADALKALGDIAHSPAQLEKKGQIESELLQEERTAESSRFLNYSNSLLDLGETTSAAQGVQPATQSAKPLPWRWITVGATIAVAGTGLIVIPPWLHDPLTAVTLPTEIHTDPPGATIHLGKRSCVTPNCRFNLLPGSYPIEVRLRGYRPVNRTVTVVASRLPNITNLVLVRESQPHPAAASKRGTLVVRTLAPGARVLVDSVPHGLADAHGEWRAVIETGGHSIQVEKTGYYTPPHQRIDIADRKIQALTFYLTPRPAKLEVRGAPRGAEIRVGGGRSVRTNGSVLISKEVPPGDQTLQVSDEKKNHYLVRRRFDPGATVTLDWGEIVPSKAATPLPVSAEVKETQDWDRVRTTSDPDQMDAFLRDNPIGAHAVQARGRLDELVWARTNSADARSLHSYLARFPRGTHASDAQSSIDDLSWAAVNKGDLPAVQTFLDQNALSRHRSEAQVIKDRLSKERNGGAAATPLTKSIEANKRGVALYKLNLLEEAIVNFDEAIRLAPKFAVAYSNRGAAHYHLGHFDRAFADFERALSVDPKSSIPGDMLNEARRNMASGVQFVGGDVSAPIPLRNVGPQYTREARAAKLQGAVLVQFVVDTHGNPQEIKVVRKLGMGLDEKAVEAVKKLRFKPALKESHPVPVMIKSEVKFQLPN